MSSLPLLLTVYYAIRRPLSPDLPTLSAIFQQSQSVLCSLPLSLFRHTLLGSSNAFSHRSSICADINSVLVLTCSVLCALSLLHVCYISHALRPFAPKHLLLMTTVHRSLSLGRKFLPIPTQYHKQPMSTNYIYLKKTLLFTRLLRKDNEWHG